MKEYTAARDLCLTDQYFLTKIQQYVPWWYWDKFRTILSRRRGYWLEVVNYFLICCWVMSLCFEVLCIWVHYQVVEQNTCFCSCASWKRLCSAKICWRCPLKPALYCKYQGRYKYLSFLDHTVFFFFLLIQDHHEDFWTSPIKIFSMKVRHSHHQ